jgi:hypothetical protein
MNKGSEELEPIIIRYRKLGNLALETVPWWEREKKMWFKEKIWETQCLYCVQWENGYRMQAGEPGWVRRWEVKLGRDFGRVLNRTQERLRQSAKWSTAVRGQARRRASEFSVSQVSWLITGRSASHTAVCRASSFMCMTNLSPNTAARELDQLPLELLTAFRNTKIHLPLFWLHPPS